MNGRPRLRNSIERPFLGDAKTSVVKRDERSDVGNKEMFGFENVPINQPPRIDNMWSVKLIQKLKSISTGAG